MISCSHVPSPWQVAAARVVMGVGLALAAASSTAGSDCPADYGFSGDSIDYYDPDARRQEHIRGVERNHLNQDVRALRRGQSTASATGDLRFVLVVVPNHPTALELMLRAGLQAHKELLPEAGPYTVECWLHRATVFRQDDVQALFLYGTYLGRRGRVEDGIAALEKADAIRGDDPRVLYNLGLMYFEQKDYERSLELAKKAYAAGFPLPGLKAKLQQAGRWRD